MRAPAMVYAAMTRCRLRLGYHRMGASQQGSSDPLGQPHQAAPSQPIQHRRAEVLPLQLGQGQKETGVVKSGLFSRLSRLGKDQHAGGPRLLARLLRDEAGSYVIYGVAMFPVLIGVGGLATEGGLLFYNKRTLQSAADGAAYSAAIAYSYDPSADITTQAKAIVASYGFALGSGNNQANVSATLTTVATTGGGTPPTAVQVTISRPQTAIFSRINFPFAGNSRFAGSYIYKPQQKVPLNNNAV
jgi:Putative Flp pilus-assembly TadE/G-like